MPDHVRILQYDLICNSAFTKSVWNLVRSYQILYRSGRIRFDQTIRSDKTICRSRKILTYDSLTWEGFRVSYDTQIWRIGEESDCIYVVLCQFVCKPSSVRHCRRRWESELTEGSDKGLGKVRRRVGTIGIPIATVHWWCLTTSNAIYREKTRFGYGTTTEYLTVVTEPLHFPCFRFCTRFRHYCHLARRCIGKND